MKKTGKEETNSMEDWEKELREKSWDTDKGLMTEVEITRGGGGFFGKMVILVTVDMVASLVKKISFSQKQEMLEAEGDRAEESWSEGIKEGKRQASQDLKKKIEEWATNNRRVLRYTDTKPLRDQNWIIGVKDLQEFLKTLWLT